MRRFSQILAALMIVCLVISSPAMASTVTGSTFKGQINVVNSSWANANFVIPVTINTQNMIDGKYILDDFSDVALQDSANADVAFMPAEGAGNQWMMFVDDIVQNGTNNYYLYTGGTTSGGKLRYFPDTDGMTVHDDASLEPASAFEVETKGFVDTGSGADKNLVLKTAAVQLYVSAERTITASITGTVSTNISQTAYDDFFTVQGVNWAAQSFTPTISGLIQNVVLYLDYSGSPTGTITVGIKATDGSGKPSGSYLCSATMTAPQSGAQTFTFSSPAPLISGTVYAVVMSDPGDSGGNYERWARQSTNVYAGGSYQISANSGSTWTITTGKDFYLKADILPFATVSAAAQSSAEHNYKAKLTGGTLTLYDGVSSLGTASYSGSIDNNANDWAFAQNGAMPYVEYIKVTVGATLKGYWYWENDTRFTDQSGNNNTATPTFRTTASVADMTATLVNFAPLNPSFGGLPPTTTAVEYPITFPAETQATEAPDQSGMTNLPGGSAVYNYLVDHDIPPALVTYPIMMIVLIGACFLAYWKPKDIGLAGLAILVVSGIFIRLEMLPWAFLPLEAIPFAFVIVKRGGFSRA